MDVLTKPEILNGEQVVNIQITNNEVKLLHEALVNKIQLAKSVGEQNIQGMMELREEFKELRKKLNPS